MIQTDKIEVIERQFIDLCLASRQPLDKAVRLRSALRRRAEEWSAIGNLDLSSKDWDRLSMRVLVFIETAVDRKEKTNQKSHVGGIGLRIFAVALVILSMFGYALWFELYGRGSLDFVYHPRASDCMTAAVSSQCRAVTELRR